MEENNNTQPNQSETANPNQPIADTTPIVSDNVNAIPEQETTAQQTNETSQVVSEPIKVIIDSDNRKSSAARIANIIAAVSVIISGVMFYYTFRLFSETQRANNIADSNYHLAKAAFESSDKSVKANYDLAKRSFENSNEDAKKRFKIDSANLKAQAIFLTENIKQFEVANRPFAQITNVRINTLMPWKKLYISYDVVNYGKLPAKVLTGRFRYDLALKNENESFIDSILPTINYQQMGNTINLIISGNSIINERFVSNQNITAWQYSKLVNGDAYIYFNGKIRYMNFVTKKQYETNFIYKISLSPLNIIAIKNEDKEL